MPAQPDPPSWRLTGRGLAVVAVLAVGVALVVAFFVRGKGEDAVPVAHRDPATTAAPSSDGPLGAGDPGTTAPTSQRYAAACSLGDHVDGPADCRERPRAAAPGRSARVRLRAVGRGARYHPAVRGGHVWTYRVEIEDGLPFDGAEFAAAVHATLSDPRGWATDGNVFQRVAGDADIRIVLASPALTDQLCAPLRTQGEVSCRNGDLVVLNALRWGTGIDDYHGDLASYREYLVNHEVGHRLGRSHVLCPGDGKPAPVMMQQTYGLDGCAPNAWPLAGE